MKILAMILLLACIVQERSEPLHNEDEFINDLNESVIDGFGDADSLYLLHP